MKEYFVRPLVVTVAVVAIGVYATRSMAAGVDAATEVGLGRESSTVTLEDGAVVSGKLRTASFIVAKGTTVFVSSDLEVQAEGPIIIAGNLIARDADSKEGMVDAPAIELISRTIVYVDGQIVGGRGGSYGDKTIASNIGKQGGVGSNIYLEAPLVVNNGAVFGGDGGESGPGRKGAKGGSAYCAGHPTRTRVVDGARGLCGGAGGKGGDGLKPNIKPGVGGRGGDAIYTLGVYEQQRDNQTPAFVLAREIHASLWGEIQSEGIAANETSSENLAHTGTILFVVPLQAGGTTPACTTPGKPTRPPVADGGPGGVGGNGADGVAGDPHGQNGEQGDKPGTVVAAIGTPGTAAKTCCFPTPKPGVAGGEGGDAGQVIGRTGGKGGDGGDGYSPENGKGGDGGPGGLPGDATRAVGGKGGKGADGDGPGDGGVGGVTGIDHEKGKGGVGGAMGTGSENGMAGTDNSHLEGGLSGGGNGGNGDPGTPCET